MVVEEDANGSPKISENPSRKRREIVENGQKDEDLFSPRFRSVAAMAGWDEEALLIASLIVEDTPDRQCKQRKRMDLHGVKSPPTNSRRKRVAQRRRSAASIPVTILDLDEDESKSKQESKNTSKEDKPIVEVKKKQRVEVDDEELHSKKSSDVSSSTPSIPCLDRLREELSCAVCLDICYEPSTTPCGHSFCKKCLSSAADKCGRKCPKCRQIISNGKYCKVNTVLWNTIQLLFPKEVEARKAAAAAEQQEAESRAPTRSHLAQRHPQITRSRALDDLRSLGEGLERRRFRRLRSQQDRDAEMALSFCKKCLSSAADKCGRKCPKCRQIISNGKYCKVNTVLWNTIQLLFPKEVEARKAAAAAEQQEAESRAPTRSHLAQRHPQITRSRALDDLRSLGEGLERRRFRRLRSQQDRDAEMALRLQREEFSEAFLGPDVDEHRSSLTSATANLRAMASRAINIRIGRGQRD